VIRFVVNRGVNAQVFVKAIHGFAEQSHEDLVSQAPGACRFGFGTDPTEYLLELADLLLIMSLERDPLATVLRWKFAREVLRKNTEHRWTMSSEDVREWALDTLADFFDWAQGAAALISRDGGEGKDVRRR
jgi:hypothetical protein